MAALLCSIASPAPADTTSTTAATGTTTTNPTSGDSLGRAVLLAVETSQLSSQLTDLDRTIASLASRISTVQIDFQLTDQELQSLRIELDDSLHRLRDRAANAYVRSSLDAAALEAPSAQAVSRVLEYARAADAVDAQDVLRLQTAIARLTPIRNQKALDAADARGRLFQMTAQRDRLETQRQRDQRELDQAGGVSVIGDSRLTAAQLAGWFESTGRKAHLSGETTIAKLAEIYTEEGAAEHVRADIAFAQSIIETGFFAETRGNNYAGVGNCDSCNDHGFAFPSPRDGVRAQIQLLRNYADPGSRAANLAHPPSAGIYGRDPAAAATAFDTFFLKGRVPLWNQMGHGNWATDPTYAGKVLKVYADMLAYAAANP